MLKPKRTAWNLKPLFKSDNDPKMAEERKTVERESYKFINEWHDRTDYLENPEILKQALDEYENWQRYYGTAGKEGFYFLLRLEQDQSNVKLKAKASDIQDFSNKILNDIQFFTLKIAKIPLEKQKEYLELNELKKYKHFLEKIFSEAKYLLSESEEKILNLKSETSYQNWVKITAEFLSREEKEVFSDEEKKEIKNFSEILSLTNSKKKKTRDSAATAFNDILAKNSDVAEAEINSILKDKKTNDELRGVLNPYILRYISDDIKAKTVDLLVKTVKNNFNVSRRYYKLKAKLFNVRKLKYHERNVEYGKIKKKYNYNETVDFIYNVFIKLDKKFADIFTDYVKKGQIDVFPRKGKPSGAFCSGYLISQPTYILLNHTNKLQDVLTLAHEAGHGINNELIKEKQNSALNFNTPAFSAEVASTFMEDFVFEEILQEADDNARLAIMMMKLNEDISTIFRQVAFNLFEKELHSNFRAKGYLSKKEIGKLFQKHMKAYMGNSIKQSPGSENWWIYVIHFRYFFYNYQYASGALIAKSFQSSIKSDPEFIEKVKRFLSAGTSDSPKNILKEIGFNIENEKFWEKGVDEINNLLNETEKLAKKLGKI